LLLLAIPTGAFAETIAVDEATVVNKVTTGGEVNADYEDIKETHWAYEYVQKLSKTGIVRGFPDGCFWPEGKVTYGEFIKMAVIAASGEDPGIYEGVRHWAVNYYEAALEKAYFTKIDIEEAKLPKYITRNDMALILSAILNEKNYEKESVLKNYDKLLEGLKDVKENQDAREIWEYEIVKVYGAGIITGYPDDTFRPFEHLSRGEAATVIYRYLEAGARISPKEMQIHEENGYLYDGNNVPYVIKNTSEYIKDYKNIKSYGGRELLWKDKCMYYESAELLGFELVRSFAETREIFERSFATANIELISSYFAVKEGELYEKLYPQLGGKMLKVYEDKNDFDYIVCNASDTALGGNGETIVVVFPNPFKEI